MIFSVAFDQDLKVIDSRSVEDELANPKGG
jgi:hypothetical protein